MSKLTIKELQTIQDVCTKLANNVNDYLLSEVGRVLPEKDRVEIVKNINVCRNVILPRIEEIIKEEKKNDFVD